MAWKGEGEMLSYGMPHKAICSLLKQWRKVAKGKATAESAGLRKEMVDFLRSAVSAAPEGRVMAALSPGGDEGRQAPGGQ